MFCQSCSAKNNEGSRFCNMCGAPLSSSRSSLDQTQLGVATSPELDRAIAESRRASSAGGELSRATFSDVSRPSLVANEAHRPSAPALALSASSMTSPASAVAPVQTHARASAPVPTPAQPPSNDWYERVPSGGFGPLSVSMKSAQIPEGFDPSLSVQLDAIGIRSPRRLWTTLAVAAAALLVIGGAIAYFARDTPKDGHASPDDPFEIGAPTAEVDFVSGSNGRPTATPNVQPSEAEASRPRGEAPTNLTTNGVPSAMSPTSAPAAPSSTSAPSTSTTTPAGTTMSGTTMSSDSAAVNAAAAALLPPPIPVENPPSRPASTTTPDSNTSAVVPPPSTSSSTGTEASAESEAESYAARVRYLVRRYHAARAQTCFSAATARNESVSGQVVIGMHIGADGRVTSSRVSRNTTGDDALGTCLATQARSWELSPPPGGGADVSIPFSR